MPPVPVAFVVPTFLPNTGVDGVGDDVRVGDGGAHRAAERRAEEGADFDLAPQWLPMLLHPPCKMHFHHHASRAWN